MKMKKDEFLEKEFCEYFSGVTTPAEVTEDAKRLIRQKNPRRKLVNIARLSSILACLVLILAVTVNALNQNKITYYSSLSLKTENVNLNQIIDEKLKTAVKQFEVLEFSTNANADYRLFYDEDGNVKYLEIIITCLNYYGREDVKIYIETTDNKVTCEDFKPYYQLKNKGKNYKTSYKFENTIENGEWVSKAYLQNEGLKYFIQTQVSSGIVDGSFTLEKYLNLIF